AKKAKKTGYIEHCQAFRLDGGGETAKELTGPGSAWMELDVLCTKSAGAVRWCEESILRELESSEGALIGEPLIG
ncbi:hypothetical protein NGM37_40805, partial [Streptomyces sp. TRM76130]|nr:hypothetical protein [Streptomyces sp. TRM76130]